jgi:hypothetical protein
LEYLKIGRSAARRDTHSRTQLPGVTIPVNIVIRGHFFTLRAMALSGPELIALPFFRSSERREREEFYREALTPERYAMVWRRMVWYGAGGRKSRNRTHPVSLLWIIAGSLHKNSDIRQEPTYLIVDAEMNDLDDRKAPVFCTPINVYT